MMGDEMVKRLLGLAIFIGVAAFAALPSRAACSIDDTVALAKAGYTKVEIEGKCAMPTEKVPPPGTRFRDCPDCPEMVVLPPGSFMMGSEPEEQAATGYADVFKSESPRHQVAIERPFAVGKFEVTLSEFSKFVQESKHKPGDGCLAMMASTELKNNEKANWGSPGFQQTALDPVVCINWDDAQAYVAWLNAQVKANKPYRLLTEAEWEYAARAGTKTAYPWGDAPSQDMTNLGADPCCAGAVAGRDQWMNTSPAESFPANAFGLHDMHGNALEWVADCYRDTYKDAPANGGPVAAAAACDRAMRGGSWGLPAAFHRSATRGWMPQAFRFANVGFRVARTLSVDQP